jgi:hypothetical protein
MRQLTGKLRSFKKAANKFQADCIYAKYSWLKTVLFSSVYALLTQSLKGKLKAVAVIRIKILQ